MLSLSYYAYVLSSTKSVIRAERDLLGTEEGGKRGGGGQGGEMTQIMYAHVNKQTNKQTNKRIQTIS
jgi:hypothetical protein